MPYIVRLKKTDGTVVELPNVFPGPAPCDQREIEIPFGGGIVHAKVERCSEQHAKTPETVVETVEVVTATQLGWIESRSEKLETRSEKPA